MSMLFEHMQKRLIKRGKEAKKWFLKREKTILLAVSFGMGVAFSFEMGVLFERGRGSEMLVVEKPTESLAQTRENKTALAEIPQKAAVAGAEQSAKPNATDTHVSAQNCVFVGSKNSRKYHSPSCSYAKRIKPENRVCFSGKEDAEKRGYVAGCIQ